MSLWIEALRTECDRYGQATTAKRIGISATTVCQILSGSYKGNLARMQARIEGALLGQTVDCPVCGDIPRDRCIEHQTRKFSATSPMRVQPARACPSCPNRQLTKGAAA